MLTSLNILIGLFVFVWLSAGKFLSCVGLVVACLSVVSPAVFVAVTFFSAFTQRLSDCYEFWSLPIASRRSLRLFLVASVPQLRLASLPGRVGRSFVWNAIGCRCSGAKLIVKMLICFACLPNR